MKLKIVIFIALCLMKGVGYADSISPNEKKAESIIVNLKLSDSLNEECKVLLMNGDTAAFINQAISLSNVYSQNQAYYRMFEVLMWGRKIVDRIQKSHHNPHDKMSVLGFKLYNQLGVSYYNMREYQKAIEVLNGSLAMIRQIVVRDSLNRDIQVLMAKTYNNLGSSYLSMGHYEQARIQFFKSLGLSYADTVSNEYSALLNNIGITYLEDKRLDKALEYHNEALILRQNLGDTIGMVQSYNNLGITWLAKQDEVKGEYFLKKAIALSTNRLAVASHSIATNHLFALYERQKRYKEALTMHKLFKQYSDSLLKIETGYAIERVEMNLFLENELIKQHDMQQAMILEQENKTLFHRNVFYVTMLVILLLVLFLLYQKSKIGNQRLREEHLELERRNLLLEKDNLELALAYKNRELTTHVMSLVNRNEMITRILNKLSKHADIFRKEGRKVVNEIIYDLEKQNPEDLWHEFEIRFQEVHTDFYINLEKICSDLTPNERKLCAFLRLNMSTKEISAITYQSVNSITVARSRLRKKLGLPAEVSFVAFLSRL